MLSTLLKTVIEVYLVLLQEKSAIKKKKTGGHDAIAILKRIQCVHGTLKHT